MTTEKRAADVEKGEQVRIIGDLTDDFGEIINLEHRGDDVLITVSYPDVIFPVDLPVLDAVTK